MAVKRLPDRGEIRQRVLLPQKHHPNGKSDFRIDDVLREQMIRKTLSDQGVVGGSAKQRGDPFETLDKLREISRGVTSSTSFSVMSRRAWRQANDSGRRLDGTFQMQVQFCFG